VCIPRKDEFHGVWSSEDTQEIWSSDGTDLFSALDVWGIPEKDEYFVIDNLGERALVLFSSPSP
jgi:hypothetical protein